jgi:thiol-disulfide isomerase/thioredoxin
MKKVLIIIGTVAVLIIATWYADMATRKTVKSHQPSLTLAAASTVGKPAPDLRLKDLDGKEVSLADLKGKVVFVNFWATWCQPCQDEIPSLIDLQNRYGAKGFTVLGIAMDDEGHSVVAPFVATEKYDVNGQKLLINYPIVIGTDEAGDKFGGIMGYPTSFLISRSGKLLMKFQGPPDLDVVVQAIESPE